MTELRDALDEWAAVRTPLSAAHLLSLADVPAASVANTEESYHDPQLHHRHFPTFVDHPDLGFTEQPRHAVPAVGHTRRASTASARGSAQHTREVLRRWADMSDADVDALVAAGVAFDLAAD